MAIKLKRLVVSIVPPFVVALLGSAVTVKEISSWYSLLNKPAWNPPNAVFGPVWTTLFTLMGISFYLYLGNRKKKDGILPVKIFFLQLLLNLGWSVLFFGLHSPALALVDIVLLWAAIAFNIKLFGERSKTAGLLLVPYILWVSFAAVLNFTVWRLNQ